MTEFVTKSWQFHTDFVMKSGQFFKLLVKKAAYIIDDYCKRDHQS